MGFFSPHEDLNLCSTLRHITPADAEIPPKDGFLQ